MQGALRAVFERSHIMAMCCHYQRIWKQCRFNGGFDNPKTGWVTLVTPITLVINLKLLEVKGNAMSVYTMEIEYGY